MSFSTIGLLLAGITLLWPLPMLVLLWMLVLQWQHRAARPKRLVATALVFLLGTANWLSYQVPLWRESMQARHEQRAWDRIDEAVATRNFERALQLLSEHPNGNAQSYLLRSIERDDAASPVAFASVLFGRCVSLLERATGSTDNHLLGPAVEYGRHDLIRAWLASASCAPEDRGDRMQAIHGWLGSLVPHPPDPKTARPQQAQHQALALRELVLRYPGLLQPEKPEQCRGSRRSCNLIAYVFARHHLPALQALLPLDDRLEEHVPPVIAHILRNDVPRAREVARHEFYAIHKNLPALFATAPLEALRAALETTPINEQALLDDDQQNSQFQRLHPIVQAADTRDAGQSEWRFLHLLLDQFPSQLARLDANLVDYYAGDRSHRQPQGRQLMQRLRTAGMDCKALQRMVGWGDTEREEGTETMAMVGCEPPADWSPYVPRTTGSRP